MSPASAVACRVLIATAISGNAPHLHILASTRVLGAHGFGATAAVLVGDRARGVFVRS